MLLLLLLLLAAPTPALTPRGGLLGCDRDEERAALIAIFEATNGTSWTQPWPIQRPNHCLWATSSLLCTAGLRGCVYFLDLQSRGLSGPVPAAPLQVLRQLVYLDMSSNRLTGGVPPSLGTMPLLSVIDFGANALTGSVPAEALSRAPLTWLSLHDNALTGSLSPALAIPTLLQLDLSGNLLTQTAPAALFALDSLQTLALSSNSLTGSIPADVSAMEALEALDLSGNLLSSTIPATLGALEALQVLDLAENLLFDSLPAQLGLLPVLQILDVSFNLITDLPYAEWIQDTDSELFADLLDPREPSAELIFPAASAVHLDGNPIGATTDDFLRMCKAWQQLSVLTCAGCGLRGSLFHLGHPYLRLVPGEADAIAGTPAPPFPRVFQLDLSNNALTGPLPETVPAVLLAFSASHSGALGRVPAAWLDLAFLSLENTTAFADEETWRQALDVSVVPLSFGDYSCLPLLGRGNRVLVADPQFSRYATCTCEPAHYGHAPTCQACPPDTYQGASFNTSSCQACPEHSSTAGVGGASLGACLCEPGFVTTAAGCAPCAPGQFSLQAGSLACATCPDGTFSDGAATECYLCPSVGVTCAGGRLIAHEGFWRDPPAAAITSETVFIPCSPADVCMTGGDSGTDVECAAGHAGVLCAECAPDYGRFDNRCFKCWQNEVSIALVVVSATVFAALMYFVVLSASQGKSTGSVVLKIVTTHVQCLLIVMRLGWPGPALFDDAAQILSTGSGSDVSMGMLFPLQCAAGISYHAEQALVLALPMMTVALAWAMLAVRVAGRLQDAATAQSQGMLAAIAIIFQMHSMVMRRVASFFECEEVSGVLRHVDDFGTRCSGTSHDTLFGANVLALLILVFGVPIAGVYLVWRATQRGSLGAQPTIERIGFLYVGYRRPAPTGIKPGATSSSGVGHSFPTQYWEGVVFVRKLALVGCATFLGPIARRHLEKPAESDQSAMAVLVLAAAMVAHCLVQPFERWALNLIELISLVALLATVAGGIAQGRDEIMVGVLAGIAHLVFLGACAGYLAHRIRRRHKMSRDAVEVLG